jgi:hypothetical protein
MSQEGPDDRQACPARDSDAGKAVSEIVKPHVLKIRYCLDALPDLGRSLIVAITAIGGKNVIVNFKTSLVIQNLQRSSIEGDSFLSRLGVGKPQLMSAVPPLLIPQSTA